MTKLQRETLPKGVNDELVRIMSKEAPLNESEKAFLFARRDYLTAEEIKEFDVKAPKKATEKKTPAKKAAKK
jgi:hypothetical protein